MSLLSLNFRRLVSRIDTNLLGDFENRKILIIESDDWGATRLPSRQIRDELIKSGLNLSEEIYTMYDGLESDSDVDDLSEVLSRYKDSEGNHPSFTLNYVLTNPNYERIKESEFKLYRREVITDTYETYSNSKNVLSKVRQGMVQGYFKVQFHGMEHVNVPLWLRLLRNNDELFMAAFNRRCFGLNASSYKGLENIQATYDSCDEKYILSSIEEGLKLFEDLFGYRSTTFIPNNYVWNPKYNDFLIENGVLGLQGMKYTLVPFCCNKGNRKKIRNKSSFNGHIRQFVRNVDFEQTAANYNLNNTLAEIDLAFKFSKPAILSSHRINYTSRISKDVQESGLSELDKLLSKVLHRWPSVSFMTTPQYLEYLQNK